MTKLYFWNNWHNGDIILERPLVRRIFDRYDVQITWGCWSNHKVLIQDLPVTVLAHARNDHEPAGGLLEMCPADHLPIYLWVGQYPDTRHTCWRNVVEVYNRQVRTMGLNLTIECGDVPMVDFPCVPVAMHNHAIYCENGPVRAMQSRFEFDLRQLSMEFPDLNFYCTANPGWQAANIFNCERLNLVQLSSVSNKCEALIGKGSGTFACAMTEANRFKPQALMNFHSVDGTTFWEYPGCPTQYLETYDQLRAFLQEVRSRSYINLTQPGSAFVTAPAQQQTLPGNTYLELLSAQIFRLAALYAQGQGSAAIVRTLAQTRYYLAKAILNLPDDGVEKSYRTEFGKAHQFLVATNFKFRRDGEVDGQSFRDAEQAMVGEVCRGLANGWARTKVVQFFLVASLYRFPHEFPLPLELPVQHAWLVPDYTAFALTSPPLFRAKGEAHRYVEFMAKWVEQLALGVKSHDNTSAWREAALIFTQQANFIPLYFNGRNVRDLFSRRAEIIERTLQLHGHDTASEEVELRSVGRPIRLGVIAPTFTPSAETAASLPIYEFLGSDFEVTLFCLQQTNHPTELYCRSRVRNFVVLPEDLKEQVAHLRSARLDILFFASNVGAVTNQLALIAAHRVARRQVTSIFSVVTTGFPHMDAYISGTQSDPVPSAAGHYRERLLQMDGSVHCFRYPSPQSSLVRIDRAQAEIAPNAITFTSAANLHKLLPELLETWATIMARVPGSMLLLFPYGPNWSSSYPKSEFVAMLTEICLAQGVAADRLRIVDQNPAPSREDLREALRIADIYLDSFPFCGSTSLMEPLEIGLPVVVKSGQQMRGAMAAAMLQELGVTELIAQDEASYIDKAVALARDGEMRSRVSERVRTSMAGKPRFIDSEMYARRMGPLLKEIAG